MKYRYAFLLLVLVLNSCGVIDGYDRGTPTFSIPNSDTTTNQTKDKINSSDCDQVIEKEFSTGRLLRICYDYTYKSAKYVEYTLDASLILAPSISKRPSFYSENEIPLTYRVYDKDYTNSGYDRGHLAPDADFDYNSEDLKIIYTMANIIPQDPDVNREYWSKLEDYEREITKKLGELKVLNGVVFDNNPNYIGDSIAISKGYWKHLSNSAKGFERCFYYNNYISLGEVNSIDTHEVSCVGL